MKRSGVPLRRGPSPGSMAFVMFAGAPGRYYWCMSFIPARGAALVAIGALLLLVGCARHRYWVGRPVREAVQQRAAELPITRCQARVHMDRLEFWVDFRKEEQDHRSDFQLEEQYLVQLIGAVAHSAVVFDQQWNTMRLDMHIQYGGMRWRTINSLYIITMSRADMERVRADKVAPEHVPQLWQRVGADKQGPDREVIEWPPDAPEPVRRPGR